MLSGVLEKSDHRAFLQNANSNYDIVFTSDTRSICGSNDAEFRYQMIAVGYIHDITYVQIPRSTKLIEIAKPWKIKKVLLVCSGVLVSALILGGLTMKAMNSAFGS